MTDKYAERLRIYAPMTWSSHLLDGGHKFPSKAGPIVERWIERVFFV